MSANPGTTHQKEMQPGIYNIFLNNSSWYLLKGFAVPQASEMSEILVKSIHFAGQNNLSVIPVSLNWSKHSVL